MLKVTRRLNGSMCFPVGAWQIAERDTQSPVCYQVSPRPGVSVTDGVHGQRDLHVDERRITAGLLNGSVKRGGRRVLRRDPDADGNFIREAVRGREQSRA